MSDGWHGGACAHYTPTGYLVKRSGRIVRMGDNVFVEILILLAAAVVAVIAFRRLRIPSSLGYLLGGAVVGPHALALVADSAQTRILAEFGIVFLLFSIGLNFSLPQIMAMRSMVFGLGTAQVALSQLKRNAVFHLKFRKAEALPGFPGSATPGLAR